MDHIGLFLLVTLLCAASLIFVARLSVRRAKNRIGNQIAEKALEQLRGSSTIPRDKKLIDQAWERSAAATGVTVEELKRGLHDHLEATVAQMAAKKGITVEQMKWQLHLDMLLLTLGPNCLTNDEAIALREGAAVPEHQQAHVERCRDCQAYIAAVQGKG
jgi:hypothetical protein